MATKAAEKNGKVKEEAVALTIRPLNKQRMPITVVGSAPYVQARFSEKARKTMRDKQQAGTTSKKGSPKAARDFELDYEQAQHVSTEGWRGIPAAAFRAALIDACRGAGFQMTRAKMSIFVEADGFDALDGTPLVRINGEPEPVEHAVRNATGVADLRVRPMWRDWSASIQIVFDGDQFTADDVVSLLYRAGQTVGIGEGRPYSKSSNGMGWGTFELLSTES